MSLLDIIPGKTEKVVETVLYTEEQLMARLKFFIGICLSLTLFGIVFVVLYSLIFVTQPLNAISPIDQKFFELIIPIATFLTGTLSGIMLAGGDKDAQKAALAAATRPTPVSGAPGTPGSFGSPMMTPSPFGGPSMPPSFPQQNNYGNVPLTMPSAFTMPSAPLPPFVPGVTMSSTGKPMPVQPPQPEL
jgi:hypothetical protein